MRYDRHHKQATLKRVIHEASQAFRSHGPEGGSVQEVMRRAGLTHGGFYAHFKSKDDLLRQAVESMFDEALQRGQTATSTCSATQGLLNYIDLYLAPRHATKPQSGCPIPALGSEHWRLSPSAREAFTAGVQKLCCALGDHLEKMGYAEPKALSVSMLNELVGAIVIARGAMNQEEMEKTLEASRSHLRVRLNLSN